MEGYSNSYQNGHQIQHYTNQLAKDTSKQLKDLNEFPTDTAVDPRQWKLQREKFTSDFTRALDTFQRAQRQAAQKEKDVIRKYKNQSGFGVQDQNLIDIEGGASQTRTQVMLEEEQNVEMLQERERAVRQLEADIGDVNQIFKDLAAMVHDQGELVDSIEANVESSSVRVEEGTQQLLQAERYQNKARRKKMILALIGIIILIILIIIIAYSAKN
ncbi:syntaxin-12 [Eurytemora carolleeae]|uniref:syntaxin-12 n=1 Tax=Eurytemora carolleeae TaxID=1294199 RepID=UPI000C75BC70|nr:syntaxin-12 [Eurytemora carolleeae]|eukprot:XP_023325653.1 syntaxin-12-like [Eurytemora affinis]